MQTPKLCRICLISDVKMFKYDCELRSYYEEIMASKIIELKELPHYFCYECAAMLYKFHKFKEKCFIGQKTLKELMWQGPITMKSVKKLDRHAAKLQSALNIISRNPIVKTYIIKFKQTPKLSKSATLENDIALVCVNNNDCLKNNSKDVEDMLPSWELNNVAENVEEYEEVCKENNIVNDEEIDVKEKNIAIVENDFDNDKILYDNESCQSDDHNTFLDIDDRPADVDEDIIEEMVVEKNVSENSKNVPENSKKKRKTGDANKKPKKFEVIKKKTDLDPNNWLKVNMSEEEAIKEFKARALDSKFISAEYKCNDCLKSFSKEDMLKRHIKRRHSESIGSKECNFCHMRFKQNWGLIKHMKQHYTKFKCLRCDLVCHLEGGALFHDEYHNGVTRKCKHCNQEFKHTSTYYTHLRTHRTEHVCTLCGSSFVSATGLGQHKRLMHMNVESIVTEDRGNKEYCKRCDVKFETKTAYENHLIHSVMHADGIEDLAVETPTGANFKKRSRDISRSNRKKPTDCYVCGKHFATQSACRIHHLAEHPRKSIFAPNEREICEICGKSVKPASIASHLNTHNRERLFTCVTCGKKLTTKMSMIRHQLTHSSEKPAACTLCDKRFKQVSSMQLHYRTFHLKEPYPKRNRKKNVPLVDVTILKKNI